MFWHFKIAPFEPFGNVGYLLYYTKWQFIISKYLIKNAHSKLVFKPRNIEMKNKPLLCRSISKNNCQLLMEPFIIILSVGESLGCIQNDKTGAHFFGMRDVFD